MLQFSGVLGQCRYRPLQQIYALQNDREHKCVNKKLTHILQ